MCKNLTKDGEPQGSSWGMQKKKYQWEHLCTYMYTDAKVAILLMLSAHLGNPENNLSFLEVMAKGRYCLKLITGYPQNLLNIFNSTSRVSRVLTVFAHHWFANQSDGGWIIPSSLFARLANQYFGINEQSVTNKSFRNTRLSGRLHYEP